MMMQQKNSFNYVKEEQENEDNGSDGGGFGENEHYAHGKKI